MPLHTAVLTKFWNLGHSCAHLFAKQGHIWHNWADYQSMLAHQILSSSVYFVTLERWPPNFTTFCNFGILCQSRDKVECGQTLCWLKLIDVNEIGDIFPSVLPHCWLGVRKSIRPVKTEWVMGGWCGYLSGARCWLFAYDGPADATHTDIHLTALCPGLPRWAGTRKVKPLWQETVSGSGISWTICKSAHLSRQITMPAPHHSVFYRLDALPAVQPTVSKHWRNSLADATASKSPIISCLI